MCDISRKKQMEAAWRLANKAHISQYGSEWRKKNKDKIATVHKEWCVHNKEAVNAKNRAWYERNRQKRREAVDAWRLTHKGTVNAINSRRRAALLQRLPRWANLLAIKKFYNECPAGYHVDHIIPLQGKTVSGLHVLENLQYLDRIENIKKGNRYGDAS